MNFIKRHSGTITIVSLIIVVLSSLLYARALFSESKRNFTEIKNYSDGLLNSGGDISFNDVEGELFTLKINSTNVHEAKTLNSFKEKLDKLQEENGKKKIFVNIYNGDELVKTEIFKYSDFGYLLNSSGILSKVKSGILNSSKELDIKLQDNLFFDDKLLNKKIDQIKDQYTEDSNGEIYYSSENKVFKVSSNKVYLSSIKEVKLNIAKVDQNIDLRDSAIDIHLIQEENVYFEQVEKLNSIIKQLEDKEFEITSELDGLDYNSVKNTINGINIDGLTISKEGNKFKVAFPKGFLNNYLTYNKELNFIELDEDKFDESFRSLANINLENKEDEILEKPSLYSINHGGITENKPNETNFKILSYGNGISFDYVSFKKELKLFINQTVSKDVSEISLHLNSLFTKKSEEKTNTIELNNHDSSIVNKLDYNLTEGLYKNKDYITEKYINYSNFPFVLEEKDVGYNSCKIKNNVELYCDDGEKLMGKLGYNGTSIILKEVDKSLYGFANVEEYGTLKKNGNLEFTRSKISIYYGSLYNNIEINSKYSNIIHQYKQELFPQFMWDYVEGSIVFDKVVFKFKGSDDANSLLVKTNGGIENNYLYLFNINLKENE